MIAAYNGMQDSQRLGGLMKGRDTPEERVMLDLVMRNLAQLRQGILALEDESARTGTGAGIGTGTGTGTGRAQQQDAAGMREACSLLRSQFGRMRGMLGEQGAAAVDECVILSCS